MGGVGNGYGGLLVGNNFIFMDFPRGLWDDGANECPTGVTWSVDL